MITTIRTITRGGGLHVLDGVVGLNVEGDAAPDGPGWIVRRSDKINDRQKRSAGCGLAGERLDENLHPS